MLGQTLGCPGLEGVCTLGDAVTPSKTLGNPPALILEQLSLYGVLWFSHGGVRGGVNVLLALHSGLREYFGNRLNERHS